MLTFSWLMDKAPGTHCRWQSRIQNSSQNYRASKDIGMVDPNRHAFSGGKWNWKGECDLSSKSGISVQVSCLLRWCLWTLTKGMNARMWNGLSCPSYWVCIKEDSLPSTYFGIREDNVSKSLFQSPYMKKPQTQDSSQKQWFSSSYEILHGCLARQCAD
jgi:hypothetical protein